MITRPPPPSAHLGETELDVASTLINEANALLRLHGEDPHNDGTGDDLPVLTEVIFDLGEPATPPAAPETPAARNATPPKPPSPAAPRVPPAPPPPRPTAPPKPQLATQPARTEPPPPPPRASPAATLTRPVAPPPPKPPAPPPQAGLASRTPAQRIPPAAVPPPVAPPQAGLAARTPAPQAGLTSHAPQIRATFSVAPPPAPAPKPQASMPPQADTDTRMQGIADELKLLDAFIVNEVETWMREELPALVTREITKLNERLRTEAIVHLRKTLLPRISEHVTGQIDKLLRDKPDV